MKKTILLILSAVCLLGCAKSVQPMDGRQMLQRLNEEHLSLLVLNNDSLSQYTQHGVRDLLALVEQEPERLRGAVVADKTIGKAAAALMVLGGVREAHTNNICTPARLMLQDAGVHVCYENELPMILNQDQTWQCPLDARLNETATATECLPLIRSFYAPKESPDAPVAVGE